MSNVQRLGIRAVRLAQLLREYLRHRPTVWIWTERALLASGLALVLIYGAARIESYLSSRAAIEKFNQVSLPSAPQPLSSPDSAGRESEGLKTGSGEVDFSLWGASRVSAYKQTLAERFDAPLAVLQISKIHLEVPVLDGTDDLTLNHAVGRIAGTAQPGQRGNIGIAGHRDGFFRGLKDVRVGDSIKLRTLSGTETYVVDQIQIVSPSDVSVLKPGSKPSITLVTCYPFYFVGSAPQRYIVSASLLEEAKQHQASQTGPAVTQTIQKGEPNASLE